MLSKKDAHSIEKGIDEAGKLYQSAYRILLSQRIAASQIDLNRTQSDFEAAVHKEEVCAFSTERIESECKTGECHRVTVEEIEDEANVAAHAKTKSPTHILIHMSEVHKDKRPQMSKHPTVDVPARQTTCKEEDNISHAAHSTETESNVHALANEADNVNQDAHLPPPPKELKLIRMTKKRFYPTGESSVGVSILAVKGWVGNLSNMRTNLHLDSCANVTLISSEYYDSLKGTPAIQQGMQMKLWQLTDKDSTLRGFVWTPIFMMTNDGVILESEAEAYVIPGMTVAILLGEDYQLTYEIGVSRNVEEGPRVHFGRSEWQIRAQQVDRTNNFQWMHQSAWSVGSFVCSKLHRRRKNKCHRQKVKFGTEEQVVRAKEDYCLHPHECKPIQVEGQLDEDRDWLVTKNLLSGADDTYFTVPNTLISAANPWVPVTNPSDRP